MYCWRIVSKWTVFLLIFVSDSCSISSTKSWLVDSFYGDSYRYLTATVLEDVDKDNETEVKLEFKTPRSDGLLVHLSGQENYFRISIQTGRIKARYKLGNLDPVEFWWPNSTARLNDLLWHTVQFHRNGNHFSLSVDNQTVSFEVSVNLRNQGFGSVDHVFLGGFNSFYHEHSSLLPPPFFGCIANVNLNGIPIKRFDKLNNNVDYNVENGCASIFNDSSSEMALTFGQKDSFFGLDLSNEAEWFLELNFQIRSSASTGILLYGEGLGLWKNNGTQHSKARVELKLDRNNLLLLFKTEENLVTASKSQLQLVPSYWHTVGLRQLEEESKWEISLDRVSEKLFFPVPLFRMEFLYLGRSVSKDPFYEIYRPRTSEPYFTGCIQNMFYNFKRYSIQNASVARNVSVGCAFDSPCYSDPCPNGTKCLPSGTNFHCLCNSESCMSSDSGSVSLQKIFARNGERKFYQEEQSSADPDTQFLYLSGPLMVREGQTSRLSYNQLVLYQQHRRYGLNYHHVIFRLIRQPSHGKLTIGTSRRTPDHRLVRHRFTYEDLMLGRINYTHDGSETRDDKLEFEVEFRNLNKNAPKSMWERRTYELPVKVTPVNDLPSLSFPTGGVVRLAENSKILITQQHIQLSDPDDSPRDVKVKIHFATPDIGYFEDIHKPGLRLSRFSQDDLITEKIRFVHMGPLEGVVTLSVSDLEGESERQDLRILAFPIQIRMETRTQVSVLHNSCEFISKKNLSFATNAAFGQSVEIRYRIVDIPKYGRIEVKNDHTGRWELNAIFNQSDINGNQVRYCHTSGGQPTTDSLKFKVSALRVKSPIPYDLEVVFIPVNIKVFNPKPFVLNNTEKAVLSREHLFAWTFPENVNPGAIKYKLTYPPKFGFLQKVIDRSKNRIRRLGLYSNFSQGDLDSGLIFFSLHIFPQYKVLNDFFRFKVITPIVRSDELLFEITFLPGNEGIKLINRTLIVREGTLQRISNDSIYLETPDDKEFAFIVRTPPLHGDFHLLGKEGQRITQQINKDQNFTSRDLQSGRVFYRHDDSESQTDRAFFEASPLYRHRTQFRIKFWYQIRITLENDNPPERIFPYGAEDDGHFYVQKGGEKTVTNRELRFVDRDADFDSENLKYYFPEEYKDGGFFWKRLSDVSVHNFTQKDINENRLVFRHLSEKPFFQIAFYVTDGEKSTKSHLEVNASVPFMRKRTNTGLVVESGAVAIFSPHNLSVLTNLNVELSDVKYQVLKQPKFGKLCVVKAGSEECDRTDLFTQEDVERYRVLYSHHGGSEKNEDEIALMAQVVHLEISLKVRILVISRGEEQQLKMEILKELVVTERSLTEIGSSALKASHPRYMPGSIRYYIIEPPKFGTLFRARQIEGTLITGENSYFEHFTQFHVNNGELFYQHYQSKTRNDEFVFNVTAGDSMLGNQVFKIKIVQHQVKLRTRNFTAPAGRRIVLDRHVLKAESTYYGGSSRSLFIFRLLESPKNGWLRSEAVTPPKDHVITFTSKELSDGKIFYVHDGEPSWEDSMTVIASMKENDEATQSENATIFITIQHENIKEPELATNLPLKMYSNKWAVVGKNLLEYTDVDNPPEQLRYLVSPQNGYLAFNHDPTKPITEFTQKDINDKRVVFIRSSNGSSAGFGFFVSDGVHDAERSWFSVEISELAATLEMNNRLVLPPKSEFPIGMDLLRASIPNADAEQIVFTVTRVPKYGQVLVNGSVRNTFTQKQINQRLVTYKQLGEANGWLVKDSFWFVISLNGSNRFIPELEEEQRFKVLISYAAIPNERLGEFIHRSRITVPEGGSLAVNATHLNISALLEATGENLFLRVVAGPKVGWLIFKGRNISEDLTFTQQDLIDHLLVYQYDDQQEPVLSETDNLFLEVFPSSEIYSRKRRNTRLKFKLGLRIIPVNNKKFQVRHFPALLRMVRGTTYTFSPEELLTEDEDTDPTEIVYSIIQGPKTGYFVTEKNGSAVERFTQAQVNKGMVKFVQKGRKKEGSFTLRVSDGRFHPVTRFVRVVIRPLTLSLVNASRITYKQGMSYVILTRQHLGADSNGPREEILYNITVPPQNGSFLWVGRHEKTTTFTQADLDSRRVLYAQMNMEAWRDAFQFEISNLQNKIGTEKLEIHVLPAVVQKPVSVRPGRSIRLTVELINASALEDRAPVFSIVKPPTYGILYKIFPIADSTQPPAVAEMLVRLPRETVRRKYNLNEKKEEINFFTLEDLKMKSIEYVNTLEKAHNPLEDHFIYELRASNVQPARGRFTIQILTQDTDGVFGFRTTTDIMIPTSTGKTALWLPTMTENFMVVIYMIAGLVLATLIFVAYRRVRISKERAKRLKKEELLHAHKLGPTPTELLENAVYASVGTRTWSSAKVKNGSPQVPTDISSSGGMVRSLTMDKSSKGTQMTPPPLFHSLNSHSTPTSPNAAARMVTFDPGRTEVISSLPMCKVTPLTPRGGLAESSGLGSSSQSFDDYRYAYQYSSSASDAELKAERLSLDRATGYRSRKTKTSAPGTHLPSPAKSTKLKENQYWV